MSEYLDYALRACALPVGIIYTPADGGFFVMHTNSPSGLEMRNTARGMTRAYTRLRDKLLQAEAMEDGQ